MKKNYKIKLEKVVTIEDTGDEQDNIFFAVETFKEKMAEAESNAELNSEEFDIEETTEEGEWRQND